VYFGCWEGVENEQHCICLSPMRDTSHRRDERRGHEAWKRLGRGHSSCEHLVGPSGNFFVDVAGQPTNEMLPYIYIYIYMALSRLTCERNSPSHVAQSGQPQLLDGPTCMGRLGHLAGPVAPEVRPGGGRIGRARRLMMSGAALGKKTRS